MPYRPSDRRPDLLPLLPLLALALPWLAGCSGPGSEPLELRFVAQVGDTSAACGVRYEGVGLSGTPVELADARLYVSNIELLRPDGTTVPVELDQGSPWQHGRVALLDFEDGTGRCSDSGTSQTNDRVVGSVPAGEIAGLRFDIGVPIELNHLDALSAPSPLNLNALYWNWRLGYIFTKIEFWNAVDRAEVAEVAEATEASPLAPTITYLAHVGSTGCTSPAPTIPPSEPCSRPNRARIVLDDFDPRTDAVRLDLAGLVDGIDTSRSVLRPPGCMAAPTDPDCRAVFANLGLDLTTGRCFTDCSDQKLATRHRAEGGG